MKRYVHYLWSVLRHKWFVLLQCCKFGIPWRGVVHDWSKFLPSEFFPYARYFYTSDGLLKDIKNETGYYKPTDTGDAAFEFAWFLHQKRNRHHWQWWVLPENNSGVRVLPMHEKYRLEMLADWLGAGRAQGTPDVVRWYAKNCNKMILHASTREWIENELRRDVYATASKCEDSGGIKLVGWIRARESDRARLRDIFDVKGKMIYNKAMGCIEYCELDDMEAVEKLRRDFPGFYPGAFTAIDEDGNQLPRDEQPCRRM